MSLSLALRDGVCHMHFRGEMTAGTVSELERQILDAVQRYNLFEVDLSAVEAIDERGVRLLLLMKRLGGRMMSFSVPSQAVLAALNSAQLSALRTPPGGALSRAQ